MRSVRIRPAAKVRENSEESERKEYKVSRITSLNENAEPDS